MISQLLKTTELGNIINFKRGHDLPKAKMISGKYPVIGSSGILGYHNEKKFDGPIVSIGRSGSIGNPHYYEGEAWPHNTCLYVDDFKGNNPKYIYYLLSTFDFSRFSGGSAVPTLNRNHIHPLEVNYIADIDTQTEIANILSSIENKIYINNKIILILEKLSGELFKSWFIDFEFPNEQGQPYKSSGGELVESELGMIPKGWDIVNLDSVTSKFATGLNPRKNFVLGEGNNFYVTIKNMGENRVYLNEKCDRVTDEALIKINKRSDLREGDLLFSGIGTIGRVYLLNETPTNWNVSESVFTMRPNDKVSSEYLYLLLLNENLQNYSIQLASGSVQKGIRMADLKSYKFPLPPPQCINNFTKLVYSNIKMIKNLEAESDTSIKLRDTLLPKLLSGEIELPIKETVEN